MKKPKLSSLLAVFLTGVSSVWLSGCASWERTTSSDMDINSGDWRYQECRGKRLVKNEMHESALSNEARRLGISLPAERKWKPMHRNRPGGWAHGPTYEDYAYGFVLSVCNDVVRILAETKTPDDERHVVLEKFLTMLRADDPDRLWYEGWFLVLDIGDKHGVHIYLPQFEEQLRERRSKQQGQPPAP